MPDENPLRKRQNAFIYHLTVGDMRATVISDGQATFPPHPNYAQNATPEEVEAVDAAGHTPGHTAFQMTSGAARLLHVGDVFHHEAFDLAHPAWATAFDYDAEAAATTRRRLLLDQAARERALVMAYHAPFPGLGYIRALGSGAGRRYEWEPLPWRLDPQP